MASTEPEQPEDAETVDSEVTEDTETSPKAEVGEKPIEATENAEIDSLRAENAALQAELDEKVRIANLIDYVKNSTMCIEEKIPADLIIPLVDFTSQDTVDNSLNAIWSFIYWGSDPSSYDRLNNFQSRSGARQSEAYMIDSIFRNKGVK